MDKLGHKILVIGVSASGKTTFSHKLARILSIPLILMDEIMWKPEWKYIGNEVLVEKLNKISFGDEWIIEGCISEEIKTFLFDRADTSIYLDYHPIIGASRYLLRWWKHRKIPRPELQGCPEKFSFKFLKLVWTKGEATGWNEWIKDVEPASKVIRLTRPR